MKQGLLRSKTKVLVALTTAAVAFGVTAAPAAADHTCVHTVNQVLAEQFGSKAQLIKDYNQEKGTSYTVGDVNAVIRTYCNNLERP